MARKKRPPTPQPAAWFTPTADDLRRLAASARRLANCLRLSASLAEGGEPTGARRDAWLDVFAGAGVALNEAMCNPALPPPGAPPPAMLGPYAAFPHLMALRAALAELVRGGRVEAEEDGRVKAASMPSRRTGTPLAAAGTVALLEAAADGLVEAVGPAEAALSAGTSPLPGPGVPRPDGPEPPRYLRWQKVRHKVRPRHYQVLNCLWGRDRVEVAELRESVWEVEGEQEIEDVTIRAELTRLNTRLDELGVPFNWTLEGGHVIRVGTRPPI
jgi:hypothetical protein